ncbi:TonB-dependent receptor domain-containing protein [Acinetobacter larvae]|uniref:TonB-dependent receptor n=1 Tax=Acinetobacter larvae TaxID=1789224 RepID=A0A1B2M2V2_9GAMM|nr:TonB-dependent receptor [Acinetobacter larvae]AOA59518.1 hypothetical protein BFG52_14960 [Acinetobacter larvae]
MKCRDIQQGIYPLQQHKDDHNVAVSQHLVRFNAYPFLVFCFISSGYIGVAQAQPDTPNAKTSTVAKRATEINAPSVRLSEITLYAQPENPLDHIDAKALSRFAVISSGDMLKGQASVQLGDSRNGGALDVNIRGVQGQSRVAVTVDGAQQSLDVYRGYAGMQNRSYVDPLLISSVDIHKGPSAKAGGAIGGTVAMRSLGVEDILLPGKSSGLRITGQLSDNGRKAQRQPEHYDPKIALQVPTSQHQGDLFSSQARSGSIASAWRSDQLDLIAAYAQRIQGNYFSGKHGQDRYRKFNPNGDELRSVAKMYGEGEEVLNSSSDTRSLLLKAVLRPRQGHQVNLSYIDSDSQFGDVMPSDIYRYGSANINQYPLGKVRMHTLSARYDYQPKQYDWIDFNTQFWMTQAKTNQLGAAFFAPASQMFRRDRAWSPQENNRYGLEFNNKSKLDSPWGKFVLSSGVALQYERLKPQSNANISIFDLYQNKVMRDAERQDYSLALKLDYFPIERLNIWAGLNYNHNKVRDFNKQYRAIRENKLLRFVNVRNAAGESGQMYWFADANGQFTDKTDPRLNNAVVFTDTNNPLQGKLLNDFGAGVKTNVQKSEYSSVVVGYKGLEKPDQRQHGLAPHMGVSYQFTPQQRAYLSYTAKHRMPSLLETSLGTQQIKPGEDLKPELAKSWELGFIHDNQQGFSAKLNYFHNDIDHFITRYYDPRSYGAMTFSNLDHFRNSGLELQSKYDQDTFFIDFSATRYFKIESCDARFAAHLRSTGGRLANTPDCTAGGFMGSYLNTQNPPKYSSNLTIGTRLFDQKLVLGSRYSYSAGPKNTLNKPWQTGATTPQMKYESVHLIDLFADYQINPHIALNFSIQNITNRYYLDPLALSYMPAPGRTMSLGLQLKL